MVSRTQMCRMRLRLDADRTDQASAIWLLHELPVQRKRMLGGCAVMMRGTAVESERRGHSQVSDVLVDAEQLQFATQHSASMVGECMP